MIDSLFEVSSKEYLESLGNIARKTNLDGRLVGIISCLGEWTWTELDWRAWAT